MNLNLTYKLRLISEENLTGESIRSDDDADSIYAVDFHMDNHEACWNIEHVLDPEKYHSEIKAGLTPEEIANVEDELRSWLESRSAKGLLLVREAMTLDVIFKPTPKGLSFRVLNREEKQ